MPQASDDRVKINFRFKQEHYEQNYPQRLVEQAESQGVDVNSYARQKLIESLDDDRMDHLTALVQQLFTKVRDLSRETERLGQSQRKTLAAILVQVCDLEPEQANQLVKGTNLE